MAACGELGSRADGRHWPQNSHSASGRLSLYLSRPAPIGRLPTRARQSASLIRLRLSRAELILMMVTIYRHR